MLRRGGLLVANIADGPPLDYTRRVLAGVRGVFGHVLLRSDPAVRTKRFGNIVVAASSRALPTAEVVRLAHGAMMPTTVVAGPELERVVGTSKPWTDAERSASPQPSDTWRIDGGW